MTVLVVYEGYGTYKAMGAGIQVARWASVFCTIRENRMVNIVVSGFRLKVVEMKVPFTRADDTTTGQ